MKEGILTGVFDSGIGGLSILKELLPLGGNFIYFGDTYNLPYGNKTKEEIISYGKNTMRFFISKGVKRVVMACNTSSALAYDALREEFKDKLEIYPLIQSTAPYIAKTADKIGILATNGTVKAKVYTSEIKKYNKNAEIYEIPCPNFVEIVENRLYNLNDSINYIKERLFKLLDFGAQKIVLGCTHYPYLMPILKKFAEEDIFINPADYMKNIFKKTENPANVEFYVSSDPERFKKSAKLFMNIKETVTLVDFNSSFCYIP